MADEAAGKRAKRFLVLLQSPSHRKILLRKFVYRSGKRNVSTHLKIELQIWPSRVGRLKTEKADSSEVNLSGALKRSNAALVLAAPGNLCFEYWETQYYTNAVHIFFEFI